MAIPVTYEFSNGAYFKKSDGSGPYVIDGDGVATLFTGSNYLTDTVANKALYWYSNGAYFRKSDGAGPYALAS